MAVSSRLRGVAEGRGALLVERGRRPRRSRRRRAGRAGPRAPGRTRRRATPSVAALMACLVRAYPTIGPVRRLAITSSTSFSKVSASNTCETRPRASASSAVSRSASRAIRMALARPIEAATSAVAPPSGMRPILVKASMKNAFELARTRSADRAIGHADAGTRSLDDADDRARHVADGGDEPAGAVERRGRATLVGELAVAADVGSGAERAPCSGQHDDADLVLRCRRSRPRRPCPRARRP